LSEIFVTGSVNTLHSDALVRWLDAKQEFSAERVQADLLTYFQGY
jgi:hypothetical protein